MVDSFALEVIAEYVRQNTPQTPMDDPTMRISPAEKARALAIKAAVEADSRTRNLSDFEYVHYALTCREESLDVVCERVYLLEAFKNEYKLLDEALQGVQLFAAYLTIFPGIVLAIDFLPNTGNYCVVCDYKAFRPAERQTDEETRSCLGGIFYQKQASQPDFQAIRNGVSMMLECMGASFANFDSNKLEQYMIEFRRAYPIKQKEWFFLNANTIATLTYGMWKRFLPRHIQETFHLSHQVEGLGGTSLSTVYNTPTPEDAEKRLLVKVWQLLARRYQNQQNFSLETATVVANP
jgi:CRAL/TRIO domain